MKPEKNTNKTLFILLIGFYFKVKVKSLVIYISLSYLKFLFSCSKPSFYSWCKFLLIDFIFKPSCTLQSFYLISKKFHLLLINIFSCIRMTVGFSHRYFRSTRYSECNVQQVKIVAVKNQLAQIGLCLVSHHILLHIVSHLFAKMSAKMGTKI